MRREFHEKIDGLSAGDRPGIECCYERFRFQGFARQDDSERLNIIRYSGVNRYDTARMVAMEKYPEGAETVLIVRGDDVEGKHQVSDALSASALAGVLKAPILPVNQNRDALPMEILQAIEDLGASNAVIVGGRAAVNQQLEDQLKGLLGEEQVRRIEHETIKSRFGTALAVAEEVVDTKGNNTVLLTRGSDQNLVDSLAIGPFAHREGYPILFVEYDAIPESTIEFITRHGIENLIMIGGAQIISEDVLSHGKSLVTGDVGRVAGIVGETGGDRYGTALEIAREFFHEAEEASIVNGYRFVDAVAAAIFELPILYVEKDFLVPGHGSRTITVVDYLEQRKVARIIGGEATLGPEVEEELLKIEIEKEEPDPEPEPSTPVIPRPRPEPEPVLPGFAMIQVGEPGIEYYVPWRTNDSSVYASVWGGFELAETQTTYGLWYYIREWAEDKGYVFANLGSEGSVGNPGALPAQEEAIPVTGISWRDMVIWLNALSEYKDYEGVYRDTEGELLRDATAEVETLIDESYFPLNDGFRLPWEREWEMAARWIGTTDPGDLGEYGEGYPLASERLTSVVQGETYHWTPGYYASGAVDRTVNADATSAVAWYRGNNDGTVQPVALKSPNALGFYDMSGNVVEWTYDAASSAGNLRFFKGGHRDTHPDDLWLGRHYSNTTTGSFGDAGFRIARTPKDDEFAGGSGTQCDPYQIATAEHLNNVRNYMGIEHSDVYFVQTENIDLGVAPWNEGEGWEPIGEYDENDLDQTAFFGKYDGGDHRLFGLKIIEPSSTNFLGVFGVIGESGEVKDLIIEGIEIKGSIDIGAFGGVTAFNLGTVHNVKVTGSVTGVAHTGGVVGINGRGAAVSDSESTVNVFGYQSIGSLIGVNHSDVENSSASGDVELLYISGLGGSMGTLGGTGGI